MLISSIDSRLAFQNAMASFQTAGIQVNRDNLSNAYLRFEVPINGTQTAYELPIIVNQIAVGANGIQITEQRLELQDSFFVSHMGYFMRVPVASNGYTGFQDELYAFNSTDLAPSMVIDRLAAFWNGYLKLTVNNKVICPQWDLWRHYMCPTTQRPAPGSSSNAFPWNFNDQRDGSQDGFYPVEPNWVLIGSRNNQMQLNYPRPFDATIFDGGGSLQVNAVIVVRGVLAQNTTPVR